MKIDDSVDLYFYTNVGAEVVRVNNGGVDRYSGDKIGCIDGEEFEFEFGSGMEYFPIKVSKVSKVE